MKFKKIILITLLLLSVLTISSVSASQNNATNEVIALENTENIDNLTVEPSNDDILEQPIASEEDCKLKASINNDSSALSAICTNESTSLSAVCTIESNILSAPTTDSPDNIVLKSSKKISAAVSIPFKLSKHYPVKKTLKTKDTLYSIYKTTGGQYGRGLTVEVVNDGRSGKPLRTIFKKVKFYYKNTKTGKYKTRSVTKIKNDRVYTYVHSPLIKGYKPIKAIIWYTSR